MPWVFNFFSDNRQYISVVIYISVMSRCRNLASVHLYYTIISISPNFSVLVFSLSGVSRLKFLSLHSYFLSAGYVSSIHLILYYFDIQDYKVLLILFEIPFNGHSLEKYVIFSTIMDISSYFFSISV